MMHERVPCDDRAISGPDGSFGVVIVLEASDAEAFVEQPDTINEFATNEQAKAHESVCVDDFASVRHAPVPSEAIQP